MAPGDPSPRSSYRYSVLLFVFARWLQEGGLHAAELEGLQPEKVSRIDVLITI